MFEPLPTPEEMARWDKAAIEDYSIRNEILMENASRAALAVLGQEAGPLPGKEVLLFAGSGNNGGDAIALARHLLDAGAEPLLLLKNPVKEYKGVSGYHLRVARKAGVTVRSLKSFDPEPYHWDMVVDGLLGTGFQGELRQDYRRWVDTINRLGKEAFVLALDVPSGLDGRTGRPGPVAVKADLTVSFEAAKCGLMMPEAVDFVGKLEVRPIGIPARVKEDDPCGLACIDGAAAMELASPLFDQDRTMHKGRAGHVLVVGGSAGLTGAPLLAALGALRSGAGLVTVACPAALATEIKAGFPEVMTLPLQAPGSEGALWEPELIEPLAAHLERFDCLVVGPGMGRNAGAGEFMTGFMELPRPSAVFDADALYWMAQDESLLGALTEEDLLTPHPGEMVRLCGKPADEVQAERVRTAADYVKRLHGAVLVLKGAGTVVADPDDWTLLCPVSTPALAVGGAGDVLSGLLASLMGRGMPPLQSACLGVYWHGLAGLLLEEEYPLRGNLAREIAHALPAALEALLDVDRKGDHDSGSCDCDA